MTLPEFLAALEKTPRDWRLDGEEIRRPGCVSEHGAPMNQCPITCMSKRPEWTASFPVVAARIGLSRKDASRIASAADGLDGGSEQELRTQLLKACGLA